MTWSSYDPRSGYTSYFYIYIYDTILHKIDLAKVGIAICNATDVLLEPGESWPSHWKWASANIYEIKQETVFYRWNPLGLNKPIKTDREEDVNE